MSNLDTTKVESKFSESLDFVGPISQADDEADVNEIKGEVMDNLKNMGKAFTGNWHGTVFTVTFDTNATEPTMEKWYLDEVVARVKAFLVAAEKSMY